MSVDRQSQTRSARSRALSAFDFSYAQAVPNRHQAMSIPPREWWVFVHACDVGYIGTVKESTEELARLAALSKYSRKGERARLSKGRQMRRPEIMHIYEDDDFDVRPE
ncbi:hypothetical protein QTI24_19195 [Variovorax sp. J22P240]|uniref:hypothetical protein n=1 Tax=Variovorax sp. J22P240 TaxID=3053514 RepID=UPI00257695DD|nr:hypothetical protein [Variovorax sp. J22P240]MDM0000748.1 hypothetical protein [Variovorax sp. J22P240]